ncbi:hypothetical protein M9H77_13852 [Catharanthus roseus]|uniref:Uncharacterized protein n=1 Tax=Catharanthus roseus TaxID=4058 RepID=A0ACC0BLI1_CATRO|nr:hypothetical protein M9H77_13852 [Catharanthus roseus]
MHRSGALYRGLHCTWLVPRIKASSDEVDGFRLGRVDPLEEGRSTIEGLAQSVYVDTASRSACGGYGNRALVWCLADINYEMPEFGSDDLVMLWDPDFVRSPTVALHVLLSSGVESTVICLDSFRLPSCARTPHVGSSISVVKAAKEKCFLITLHELFVKLHHHCFKEITKAHTRELTERSSSHFSVSVFVSVASGRSKAHPQTTPTLRRPSSAPHLASRCRTARTHLPAATLYGNRLSIPLRSSTVDNKSDPQQFTSRTTSVNKPTNRLESNL